MTARPPGCKDAGPATRPRDLAAEGMQTIRVPGAADAEDDGDDSATAAYGWFVLALVGVVYVAAMYAVVVSKLVVPETGHYLLDWVRDDNYYCLLVPCTWVVTLLAVYLNWLGMKYFRHN